MRMRIMRLVSINWEFRLCGGGKPIESGLRFLSYLCFVFIYSFVAGPS